MNTTLLDLLRVGGYILYSRHGEATVGEDRPDLNFRDCLTQRNLSDLGRKQSIIYGQNLRRLQVPISYPVLASPFRRTIESAHLAFGSDKVFVDPFWFHVYKLNTNISTVERQRILESLASRLEAIPSDGNRVIIAHSFPEGIGLGQMPDMGTFIIKPKGKGYGFEIVAKLTLEDLQNLNRAP